MFKPLSELTLPELYVLLAEYIEDFMHCVVDEEQANEFAELAVEVDNEIDKRIEEK